MKEYIKAIRLPACIFAGIITLVGFRITCGSLTLAYLPAIVTTLIAIATMVHNDLCDRFNDVEKGKRFAFDHLVEFKRFVIFLWFLAVGAGLGLIYVNPLYLVLVGLMIISGITYSELQQLPLIPNTIVALTVASAALYPIFDGYLTNPRLWIFFLIIFFIIYAREILKDFDDKKIDPGYKWSLLEKYGQEHAKFIAVILLFGATFFVGILTLSLFCLPGLAFSCPALILLSEKPKPKIVTKVKLMLDICLLGIVLIFLIR